MSVSRASVVAITTLLVACGSPGERGSAQPDAGVLDARGIDSAPDGEPDAGVEDDGCPDLFSQAILPEWRLTVSDDEWAQIEDEFLNRVERELAGLEISPYHPLVRATYDDGSGPVNVDQVLVRLKGQSSWVQAVEYDLDPKMQFVLAFNEVNTAGRFHGVRKVELDMPRTDWTFLRQRLALHTMRGAGQDAQCANNARLTINGQYYGLYTHLERLDKEFLQRVFGKADGADDGDLWKAGYEIRTNEDSYSPARIDALWAATSADEISALADLDQAVYEWASEAVLPHADGFQIGQPNFFVYDHPQRGFLWLPTDLDTAFDYYPHDIDLAFPQNPIRDYDSWIPYATTLADPAWMDAYVNALMEVNSRIDPAAQAALVVQWSEQIASAAQADPHRPFSMADHQWAGDRLRGHLPLRHAFVDDWVACRHDGEGVDVDGDGAVFCHDCDDRDSEIHPGQPEICNGIDDDCDGFLDEGLIDCEPPDDGPLPLWSGPYAP